MLKDEILENENRSKIYSVIETTPGIHLRELQRVLDMPLTTLDYHLDYMTRKRIIFSETKGNIKRFYAKLLDAEDKKVLAALRQRRMRQIVLTVLANKKTKFKFLAEHLGLPSSTLSYYLTYLVDRNILVKEKVGYESLYTVRDEDRIAKVLTAYKSSFLDKLVDRALNTWMESSFHREK